MLQYQNFLRRILDEGQFREDRTGTGTISIFGHQMTFDTNQPFPILTTKEVHFNSVVHELLWFLSGDTNVRYLKENRVRIWDEWADENGDLGRVYGAQWRSWRGVDGKVVDQIANVMESLKTDPYGRRHIVSAWNPAELDQMALPPCHMMFQFYVRDELPSPTPHKLETNTTGKKFLDCQLYQRSADAFLGVPFNIASYSLLVVLMAKVLGYHPGKFVWTGGDCHIYSNHLQQVITQLQRTPLESEALVELVSPQKSIFDFKAEDIVLCCYEHYPAIKGKVSV